MMNSRVIRITAMACTGWLIFTPAILSAQASNTQAQNSTPTPSPTPSPGAGITSGTAPIETTLFAYRALASDAEAISGKIAEITREGQIVIGSATDLSAFVQWRTIMGQTKLLTKRAEDIDKYLTDLKYTKATPLAALSITKNHPPTNFTQGGTGTYTVTVSNSASASPTSGMVTVTEAVPDGLTLTSMSGTDWDCSPPPGTSAPSHSCRRSDVLSPGASYSAITVRVSVNAVASTATYSVVNSVTVSGGGSAASSATDSTAINGPAPANPPPPARGRGSAQRRNFASTEPSTTPPTTPTAPAPAPSSFGTSLTAIPVFIQLAQFLSTAFAVNQTLSPSQGSMTDAPLINAVAQHLRSHGLTIFVPSVYTPKLLTGKDLDQTYLLIELKKMESKRSVLWKDIGEKTGLLMMANFVTQNPTKYSAEALIFALEYSGAAQSVITSAQTIATNIDSFEASLFGGQTATPSQTTPPATTPTPASTAPAGSAAPSGTTPATGTTAAPATTGAAGSTPAGTPAATNQLNPATQPTPAASNTPASSPAQTAISLSQILGADLLAQRIWPNEGELTEKDINSINFLTVHALESGGSQLNKTNIFYGTHIFFSGGSVMTFSLYKSTGDLTCSGFAYNYRGNIREKHYDAALRDPTIDPAILSSDSGCIAAPSPQANSTQITEGMTAGQVEALIGAADVRFEEKGTNFVYRSRGIVVVFRRGKVQRVLSVQQ